MKAWLLGIFIYFISFLATAQVPSPPETNSAAVNSSDHIGQVVFALLFVVALIFILAWFYRRLGQGTFGGNGHIKMIANLPIGTRERIALIEVAGKHILVGVTTQQINTLHTFENPIELQQDKEEASEFAKKIKDILSQGGSKKDFSKVDGSPE